MANLDSTLADIDRLCSDLLCQRGKLGKRLNQIRVSQPLAVLRASMKACPAYAWSETEKQSWNRMIAELDRMEELLISCVCHHLPGGFLWRKRKSD